MTEAGRFVTGQLLAAAGARVVTEFALSSAATGFAAMAAAQAGAHVRTVDGLDALSNGAAPDTILVTGAAGPDTLHDVLTGCVEQLRAAGAPVPLFLIEPAADIRQVDSAEWRETLEQFASADRATWTAIFLPSPRGPGVLVPSALSRRRRQLARLVSDLSMSDLLRTWAELEHRADGANPAPDGIDDGHDDTRPVATPAPADEPWQRIRALYRRAGTEPNAAGESDPLVLSWPRDLLGALAPLGSTGGGEPSVDVVVVVRDAFTATQRTLRSLLEHTDRRFGLIVVDNASDAPVQQGLQRFGKALPRVRLVRYDEPQPYCVAATDAISRSRAEWIVFVETGAELPHGWLGSLLSGRDADVGVISAITRADAIGGRAVPPWADDMALAAAVGRLAPDVCPTAGAFGGPCLAVRREALAHLDAIEVDQVKDLAAAVVAGGWTSRVCTEVLVTGTPTAANVMQAGPVREALRDLIADALTSPDRFGEALRRRPTDPVSVAFVLGERDPRSYERLVSALRRARALTDLGLEALVAAPRPLAKLFAGDPCVGGYRDRGSLERLCRQSTVLCACDAASVPIVTTLRADRPDAMGAYLLDEVLGDGGSGDSNLPSLALLAENRFIAAAHRWAGHSIAYVGAVPPAAATELRPSEGTVRVLVDTSPSVPAAQPALATAVADALAREPGITVTRRHFHDDRRLAERFAKVDIVVDPALFQFSVERALLAQAQGCVLVASRHGAADEVVEDGVDAVLADPLDPDAFIDEVRRLAASPSLLQRFREAALDHARRRDPVRSGVGQAVQIDRLWSDRDRFEERKDVEEHAASAPPTVVIPVYNAREDVRRCVESVLGHTDGTYRLLLIDDCSPDAEVLPMLQRFAADYAHVELVAHAENRGYTATVNDGCQRARGDVVLLNSDTIVTGGWLTKLREVAYSRPRVATVTPLSNAAGAFNVPRNNVNAELPDGFSVSLMGSLTERLSQKVRPQTPTGNGFCMYITSEALRVVGGFDEESFPRGYGEENDFCMRAGEAGFVHLIDDATFIYHRRSASFGEEKQKLIEQSRGTLRRLHPTYKDRVTEFLQDTSLDPLRQQMTQLIKAGPAAAEAFVAYRPTVLILLHSGGGGTPQTNEDMVRSLRNEYDALVLRCDIDEWVLQRLAPSTIGLERVTFDEPWLAHEPLDEARIVAIEELCERHRVDLVHIRSLVALGPELIPRLKERGLPVVFSFHDFYTVCPTIQLLDEQHRYCAGHCTPGDGRCAVADKWFRRKLPPLKHAYVHTWRERMAEGLASCDRFITTSETAAAVVTDHFPRVRSRIEIVPHGRDVGISRSIGVPPRADEKLRVVAFGALGYSKGIEMLDAVMRLDRLRGGRFEWHLLGEIHGRWDAEDAGAIVHGPYERDALPMALSHIRPNYAIVASIWPETYCHTLTEAWMNGIPVMASDIGTLRERILEGGGGWLLPHLDPEAWYEGMLAVADTPSEWNLRRAEIAAQQPRSVDEMAAAYRRSYRELLHGRHRPILASG